MSEVKIPEGYKQTEVGVIPEDWGFDKTQNLLKITTGNKNTQDKIATGRYPFFVRSQTIEQINSFSFDGEGVLTAGDGVGTGKIYHYVNGKFDFHQRVYLMHSFDNRIDGYYFYLYFSNNFYDRIMSMTAKSSVDSVRRIMIADMNVVLPPKQEQTAIATALSDIDDLIGSLEKLIAKKEAIKTATMQQLLTGKTRLPEFATREDGSAKGFKQTELELIPEDWGFDKLDSLSEVIDPHPSHRAPAEFANGIPFLGIGDINERGEIIKSNFRKVGSYVLEEHASRYRLGEGLIGLGRVASIGKVIIFNNALKDCTISPTLGLIRPRNINLDYLGFFLKSEFITNQFRQVMSGSTRSSVGMIVLRKLIILTPSKLEQTAIATILSDMDSEIQALQKRLEKTRDIKQGMMQQLLTGKVRLVSSTNKGV